MSLFKELQDYLAYLNLVVAISASTLAAGATKMLGIDNYFEYGLFGFFATFCVYNSQRLFKQNNETSIPRLNWLFTHRKLVLVLSSVSLILSIYYFVLLINGINVGVIVLMGIATLISLFYVVKLGKKNLREISYVKTHSIALTWTLVILIFPIVNENISLFKSLLYFIMGHYLYFLAIAATFDIKDLKVDPSIQRTIPQIVGFQRTKTTATILLLIATLGITYFQFSIFILTALALQIILIGAITDKRKDIYFDLLIDGTISILGMAYLFV